MEEFPQLLCKDEETTGKGKKEKREKEDVIVEKPWGFVHFKFLRSLHLNSVTVLQMAHGDICLRSLHILQTFTEEKNIALFSVAQQNIKDIY